VNSATFRRGGGVAEVVVTLLGSRTRARIADRSRAAGAVFADLRELNSVQLKPRDAFS